MLTALAEGPDYQLRSAGREEAGGTGHWDPLLIVNDLSSRREGPGGSKGGSRNSASCCRRHSIPPGPRSKVALCELASLLVLAGRGVARRIQARHAVGIPVR